MSYLIFDTETNTLPKSWKAPVSDTNNWPRIVQLAWELVNDDLEVIKRENHLIRLPKDVKIDPAAQKIHGFDASRLEREGKELSLVLALFSQTLKVADRLVAHNIDFDSKVLGCEYIRQTGKNSLKGKPTLCTMKSTVDYCGLPGRYGYKWPTLQELHTTVFGTGFKGAHDAATDVAVTRKCLLALIEEGGVFGS